MRSRRRGRVEASCGLGAFFAAAYVMNGCIAGRSTYFFGPESEGVRLPGSRWLGIPEAPAWLAWFAAGYVDVVGDAFGARGTRHPDGLFVRMGKAPMNRGGLMPTWPVLPEAFRQPAVCIPELRVEHR
jgi:hypothetical protein